MKKAKILEIVKKIGAEICRIAVGALFVFSGFVKAVDPLGFTYKIQDYLAAFGLPQLSIFALPASIILSAFEFSLGVCLLLGIYRKITSFFVLMFMLVMTPLTLYLAIANPVTDCGCFGDAWIISNWETFFKNVVLLIAAIVLICYNQKITPLLRSHAWFGILYSYIFIFSISFYCYSNLPILDFRPYKIGNNIPALMEIPEGMPQDKYETTLIYSKDGLEKEFDLTNYPKGDDSWTFVDSKNKLIEKGFVPPIHDFMITTEQGDDITDIVLADTTYTFLLISYKLEKADDSDVDRINEIYDYTRDNNYPFLCLTASSSEQITDWAENTGAEYPFCLTDEITLKTIIRSNPGLVLIKSGMIVNKWAHGNIPEGNTLKQLLPDSSIGIMPENTDKQKIKTLALILLVPLALVSLIDLKGNLKKKRKNKEKLT